MTYPKLIKVNEIRYDYFDRWDGGALIATIEWVYADHYRIAVAYPRSTTIRCELNEQDQMSEIREVLTRYGLYNQVTDTANTQ
jgi:hypothetical protein